MGAFLVFVLVFAKQCRALLRRQLHQIDANLASGLNVDQTQFFVSVVSAQ
jgi:hypothetical protein